jgi:hypothetical protein
VTFLLEISPAINSRRQEFSTCVAQSDARYTRKIKSRIAITEAAFNRKKTLFANKLDLSLRKKLLKFYIWSIALYDGKTSTLRKVDQGYLESFGMWCWKRMENIYWTDRMRNEKVLVRGKDYRNILNAIKRRKANCIGHILRRNCLLKHIIEDKIE